MNRDILIENAKGWNLIANGLKCGISLDQSIALVEERCNSPELRPLFGALISDCETHRGVPPPKTTKYYLVPGPVYELIFLGWATGMLDNQLSLAVTWLRAQLVFEKDPPISECPAGARFRNLAAQIEKGANPDSLIELSSLSNLERAFYLQGYNSGTLDTCLRRLADVIDFEHAILL